MPFFVYILRCADGSYYAGHTDDIEARLTAHDRGTIEGYTRKRRPVRLVFAEEVASREEALAREMQIKGWSRAKKEALVKGNWKRLQWLSRWSWFGKLTMTSQLCGPSTGSGRTVWGGAAQGGGGGQGAGGADRDEGVRDALLAPSLLSLNRDA